VSDRFEELDWQATPMGEISLRRRREPVLDVDVYEVQLNDEFLMSSLFTVSEIELAHLGIAAHGGHDLEVLVGGLGLGYTARAALADDRVRNVTVVEALAPVLEWHRRELLPDLVGLATDPRCHLVHDDFFALVEQQRSAATYDVLLIDVDHTPGHVLDPSHAAFYSFEGLGRLASLLRPDGVFALWSDDPPDPTFLAVLRSAFLTVAGHVVSFPNPLTGGTSACSVYVARQFRAAYDGDDFYCDVAIPHPERLSVVHDSEEVLAFHHTQPFWETHVVVTPKRHLPSFTTLTADDEPIVRELLGVVQSIARDVEAETGAAGVLTNLGRYQDSKHLHVHVHSGPRRDRPST